jgi:hypothetical protein
MAATGEHSLRERREAIMTEHLAAENRHDIEAAIATFHRPRYEVNGEESDGEEAVRDLLQELMAGFPDFHAEVGTPTSAPPRSTCRGSTPRRSSRPCAHAAPMMSASAGLRL